MKHERFVACRGQLDMHSQEGLLFRIEGSVPIVVEPRLTDGNHTVILRHLAHSLHVIFCRFYNGGWVDTCHGVENRPAFGSTVHVSQRQAPGDGGCIDGRKEDMPHAGSTRTFEHLIKVGFKRFKENVGVCIDQHGARWVHSFAGPRRRPRWLRCGIPCVRPLETMAGEGVPQGAFPGSFRFYINLPITPSVSSDRLSHLRCAQL